jgi:hypothetical protein
MMDKESKRLMFIANIGDKALVDTGLFSKPSLHEGVITMISRRGIDVAIMNGIRFIRWCNVKEIRKGNG